MNHNAHYQIFRGGIIRAFMIPNRKIHVLLNLDSRIEICRKNLLFWMSLLRAGQRPFNLIYI